MSNFNDTTPATPDGGLNVKWQASGSNISAYVPVSSLPVVSALNADHVVVTRASDSNNPKRVLVSSLLSLSAAYDPVTDPLLLMLT